MRAATVASIKSLFAFTLVATITRYSNVVVADITSVVTNETWPLACVVDGIVDTTTTSLIISPFGTTVDAFNCEVFCDCAEEGAGSVSVFGSEVIRDDNVIDAFNWEGVVIMQYQVCACDYITIGQSSDGTVNITFADGQKACKFDEKELVFPTSTVDNNNETVACADIGLNRDGSDCNDYCSDVVFKDFAPDTPVNSISSGSSDPAYISGCTCSWKNMNIDACMGSSGGGAAIDGAMRVSKVFIVTAIVSSIMALFF